MTLCRGIVEKYRDAPRVLVKRGKQYVYVRPLSSNEQILLAGEIDRIRADRLRGECAATPKVTRWWLSKVAAT